jgi:hypothetical protein
VQLVGELVRRLASTHGADLVRSGKPVNVDAAAAADPDRRGCNR